MKKYVIVGAGSRAFGMFVKGLKEKQGKTLTISGVYDINKKRSEFYREYLGPTLTVYTDFDEMLDRERPDAVIVATVDSTHHEYVVRALDLGYDVISEKPLTNTYEGAMAIREAERRSGKQVRVTFNCRFMPIFAKVKELLLEDRIGKVLSISYNYTLNRWHGGDYFKRWHRKMEYSQGMLLHKSTHHFDVINWLLCDEPKCVAALANRVFYGDERKVLGERCSRCERASECESYRSQSEELDKRLYFDAESEDGYIRDKCAYLPDSDIYDNMSVSVMYKGGAILSYTLNLFSMREGYTMTIVGERGMLIVDCYKSDYGDGEELGIKILNMENEVVDVPFVSAEGAHGGGDKRLLEMMFGDDSSDPLGQLADSFAGISSAVIGMAANESIKTGKTVDVTSLLDDLR